MSFLDEIKKSIKSARSYAAPVKAPKTAKHPRDNVATLIYNSIEYYKDNSFVVNGRKGVKKKPELCYTIKDGVATVKLTYSREILDIGNGQKYVDCDETELVKMLELMHKGVLAGKLDAELDVIQKKRKASQNAGKTTKKAK